MKLTVITLLTFTLVLGTARSQDMDDMDEMDNKIGKIKGMVKKAVCAVAPDVAEVILKKIDPAMMKQMQINMYNTFSGVNNVAKYSSQCLNAIFPTKVCELFKTCVPETLRKMPELMEMSPAPSFMEVADECLVPKIAEMYGAEYMPNDFNETARGILVGMVSQSELPSDIQNGITTAINNNMCRIPSPDEPMCERMKLHCCLIDYCVMSMAEKEFA